MKLNRVDRILCRKAKRSVFLGIKMIPIEYSLSDLIYVKSIIF